VIYYQAEDGIRDRNVTGVQTCALPILEAHSSSSRTVQPSSSRSTGFAWPAASERRNYALPEVLRRGQGAVDHRVWNHLHARERGAQAHARVLGLQIWAR